jgi:putative ABC transport system permease protein
MFSYYLGLATRSLRRNVVITALMVTAVGVGIGASMTVYTVVRAMSGNPIPQKAEQIFTAQIDVWGPPSQQSGGQGGGQGADYGLPDHLTYRDAEALMKAQRAPRQAVMYALSQDVSPVGARAFRASGRATSRDFFAMFEVPFRSGAVWDAAAEEKRENVVVLGAKLADRVFPHTDPLGKVINLSNRDYRIVGVVQNWAPMPRFYDLDSGAFGDAEQFFMPFDTAIDRQLTSSGGENCQGAPTGGWEGHLNSDFCPWLQFWAELPTAAQARDFKAFLRNYAAEQRQLGRFHWPPRVELRSVADLLIYNSVVPPAIRAIGYVADGFLIVCLVNAVGLLLAKFASRATELALRRALGASQGAIFRQCVTETLLIGLLGGIFGLLLTAAGLAGLRALLVVAARQGFPVSRLVSLNADMVVITLAVAMVVTVCAGLYPTWRASRVQPAWQLKAQ